MKNLYAMIAAVIVCFIVLIFVGFKGCDRTQAMQQALSNKTSFCKPVVIPKTNEKAVLCEKTHEACFIFSSNDIRCTATNN